MQHASQLTTRRIWSSKKRFTLFTVVAATVTLCVNQYLVAEDKSFPGSSESDNSELLNLFSRKGAPKRWGSTLVISDSYDQRHS